MSDTVSNPLLDLIKEKGLVDDLQYEDVKEEIGRSAKSPIQILQDFGILDLDSILQIVADYLGTEAINFQKVNFTPDLLKVIPGSTARMYQCIPVADYGNTIHVAFVDPLNPNTVGELGFAIRKDVQLVVADPVAVQKAIEKHYAGDTDSVSDVLKTLGNDS